jgi:hypothetical protein
MEQSAFGFSIFFDVAQAGLKLKILLPWPPEYQDYRCALPLWAD